MTLSNIPFAIDGALISSALLRKGLYAAIGQGGVVGINDLKVSASVPNGQSLQVASGVGVILNGYQSNPNEVYVASNPGGHAVGAGSMPGSSPSTTYWMVCLVVGDPQSGYSQTGHPFMPADFDEAQANTFQYVRVVILPCSSTANDFGDLGKSYPGLALARLAIPPSTTTITDAMITDLRTRVDTTETDSGWINLPMEAGWQSVGYGWHSVQYRVLGTNLYLRGLMVRAGANVAADALIATLPPGARPTGITILTTVALNPNGDSVAQGQRIDIHPSGDIRTKTSFGSTYYLNFWAGPISLLP